jgi:polyphosphate kinase
MAKKKDKRKRHDPPAHRDIVLPKRQRPAGYTEPNLPLRHIPTPF